MVLGLVIRECLVVVWGVLELLLLVEGDLLLWGVVHLLLCPIVGWHEAAQVVLEAPTHMLKLLLVLVPTASLLVVGVTPTSVMLVMVGRRLGRVQLRVAIVVAR